MVHLLHAAGGMISSGRALGSEEVEEEWRLLYVAVSRARKALYLYFPRRTNPATRLGTVE